MHNKGMRNPAWGMGMGMVAMVIDDMNHGA